MLGCFGLILQAQKGNTYFTELAERVEYGNYGWGPGLLCTEGTSKVVTLSPGVLTSGFSLQYFIIYVYVYVCIYTYIYIYIYIYSTERERERDIASLERKHFSRPATAPGGGPRGAGGVPSWRPSPAWRSPSK